MFGFIRSVCLFVSYGLVPNKFPAWKVLLSFPQERYQDKPEGLMKVSKVYYYSLAFRSLETVDQVKKERGFTYCWIKSLN